MRDGTGSARRTVAALVPAMLAVAALVAAACGLAIFRRGEDQGREVYLDMCGSCHGVAARGDGPVAELLRKAPPDLTRLAERHTVFSREYVKEVVTGKREVRAHGTREMPVWNTRFPPEDGAAGVVAAIFFGRRLELLLDYLESVQAGRSASPGP
jgi:mono/diheme cytochrome c family protein